MVSLADVSPYAAIGMAWGSAPCQEPEVHNPLARVASRSRLPASKSLPFGPR